MNQLFISAQQARIEELQPDWTISAVGALPDEAWADPHFLVRVMYRLVLLGA